MADYLVIWVDYALEQYLALDQDASVQLSERLRLLAADPKADARYDAGTDRWSADFDSGNGLIVYIVNDDNRRVVVLRVIHLSCAPPT